MTKLFGRLKSTVKNNPGAWIAVGLLGAIPFAYNNCSAQMSFQATDDSLRSALNSSGAIVINDGADYTNSKNVTVNIVHMSATQMYVTDDPTCATGGSWEPVGPLKPWELKDLNRSATVYAKFTNENQSSVESECLSDSIIHDDIAPTLVVAQPDAYTNAATVELAITADDSGSGVAQTTCTQAPGADSSGGSLSCAGKLLVSGAGEGSHSYNVLAVDRAGNVSPSRNVSFVVDRTAPVVAFNLTPAKISNVPGAEFRFSGNDALAGIARYECRVGSAAFAPCSSPVIGTYGQGAQHFEVQAVDKAGNRSDVSSYDWTIDSSAPTVMITKMPSAYSNSASALFEFSGTDSGVALTVFECQLDSAAVASCFSPKSYSTLAEGSHTFSVVGIDSAGNRSAPARYTWLVDVTAPTVSIVSGPAGSVPAKQANFTFSATDGGSGVEAIECRVDADAFAVCGTVKSFSALAEGQHTVEVRAKDRAGNVSAVASRTWKVDSIAPIVTITSGPAPFVNVRAATVAFAVQDADATAAAECKVDSGAYAACASPKTILDLAAGSHIVSIRATDAAGNMSAVVSHAWSIDLTPPAINVGKAPQPVIFYGGDPEVAFTVTDVGSGLNSILCGLQSAQQTCPDVYAVKFARQSVGNYVYVITATDKAGNISTQTLNWSVTNQYAPVEQSIAVNRSNKLDVLVVIDNSGSMNTEQANMASRFGTFIDKLAGINWQVGIVTTDVSSDADKKDGRLLQFENGSGGGTGQYIISSSMALATAKSWFGDTVQRPADEGSGNEQGVAAAYRALQRSQQTGNAISARNTPLFRADAALAVLVVTDADETNPSGTQVQNKPETLISYVKSLWPSKPFSFHSIIVPIDDVQCKGINGNESYGYNYDTLSQLTGGIRGTVCANDYSAQLANIGQSTQDLITSVSLNCAPVDTNGDGMPDVQIVTANGSTPPSYTVVGMRLNLSAALPVGTNRILYSCPVVR